MSTTFVSPGLYITEKEESLFFSSLADTPLGAVRPATWGPIDEATLSTSQQQLVTTFGPLTGVSVASYSTTATQYPGHQLL